MVGGNRFVGQELAWRLLAAGHEVTILNRGTRDDAFGDRVTRLHADRSTAAFAAVLGAREFDAAVDFAAFNGAEVQGAVDVLQRHVGHYVMISSGQVYLVRDVVPAPACETDYAGALMAELPAGHPDHGEWEYGMGKRAGEDVLAAAWEHGRFPATRLRIPMVNGERDYYRRVESYLWRLLDGGPLLVPDGGTRPTRHVYGGAVVRAILSLLGDARTFGQAYNLCQDETPTLVELLTLIAELLGARAVLVSAPAEALLAAGLDPAAVSPFSTRWMSFLDPSRARAELGFTHEPVRTYLDKVVTSLLAHMPKDPPPGYASRQRELELARNT